MGSARRLALAAAVLAVLVCSQGATALVIESAKREINLTTQRVLYSSKLSFKNDGKKPTDSVTLCLPAALHARASVVQAGQNTKKDGGPERLKATGAWATPTGAPADVLCADFTLAAPIPAGGTAEVVLESVHTKILTPKPATMRQGGHQRMLFSADSAHLVSPYKVLSDTAILKLPVANGVESHTASEPFKMEAKTLTLGPYTDAAPWTVSPYVLHYKNDFPTLEAASVVREISISHWGNVYYEEKYDIAHNGAKITGEWSRLETMTKAEAARAAAPQLPAVLPPHARWIYFRDDIGNISTSKIVSTKQSVQVVLMPRFPLFGGWATKFILGYSVPLGAAVAQDERAPGEYALLTSALPAVRDVVVDNLEIRVVLPEGATAPKVDCGLEYELSHEMQYTYFDVLGRTVVVLRAANVAPESVEGLVVSYRYSPTMLLLKPVALSAALAAIFVAVVLASSGSSTAAPTKVKTS